MNEDYKWQFLVIRAKDLEGFQKFADGWGADVEGNYNGAVDLLDFYADCGKKGLLPIPVPRAMDVIRLCDNRLAYFKNLREEDDGWTDEEFEKAFGAEKKFAEEVSAHLKACYEEMKEDE